MNLRRGFTLIELMIVVAIIGILAAIATGKFGDLLGKARESSVKNNLGSMRSAISIYYSDTQVFPTGPVGDSQLTLFDSLVPTYFKEIPTCYVRPYHDPTQRVDNVASADYVAAHPADNGGWIYVSDNSNGNQGLVAVECYHTDTRGASWTSF